MSEMPRRESNPSNAPYWAYGIIATISGFVSLIIAAVAINRWHTVSDGGMLGIGFMVLAPGLTGVGISAFVYLTAKAQAGRAPFFPRHEPTTPASEGFTAYPPRRHDS